MTPDAAAVGMELLRVRCGSRVLLSDRSKHQMHTSCCSIVGLPYLSAEWPGVLQGQKGPTRCMPEKTAWLLTCPSKWWQCQASLFHAA